MKLDSSRAWNEALASLSANRELVLTLAGVFFLLPALALGLIYPQPEPPAGMQPEQMLKMLQGYYLSTLPLFVPMLVLQIVGTLAVLTLFTDRSRPTVGEAIRQGLAGTLPYIAAQLLVGLALMLGATLLIGLAILIKLQALAVLGALLVLIAFVYVSLRTLLVPPAIAVDRVRNPIEALRRSWALTRGNTARILLFMALVLIAFLVLLLVVTGIAGALFTLLLGAKAGEMVLTVLSALLGAGFTVLMAAIVAAIHRQLSGESGEAVSRTFE